MRTITKHFINGDFVESHGTAIAEVRNPTNNELIGHVTMGNAIDAERAIAAAKAAFPGPTGRPVTWDLFNCLSKRR